MFQPGDHIVDFVDDYLHGLLAESESRYFQEHVQHCPICHLALDQAHERRELMRTASAIEPSEELIARTVRRVGERGLRGERLMRLGWRSFLSGMAAAVLVAAALHLYYLNLKPSPYDLRVVAPADFITDTDASLRAVLVKHDGAPVAGAAVEIDLRDRAAGKDVHLASFRTDSSGTGQPRFRLPDWKEGAYELRITAQPGGSGEVITRSVRLRRSWKLMLSTDKPVYQPGQTIHLRALTLRQPDLKPLAGQEATFRISDPRGNVIFKQRVVTSRFGICSTDCEIAGEVADGAYAIECAVGDTQSKSTVDVKKYVLPKFKIEFELDRPYYQPGQTARAAVSANYFFGRPVAGGAVEITLLDAAGSHLRTVQATTDDRGAATLELPVGSSLVGTPQDGGDARLYFEAVVRDSAGQEQRRSISRIVTSNLLRIELIPESGQLVADVANTIYLAATYPDGRPAQVRATISGQSRELQTGELGVTSFELTPRTGQVSLFVRATDAEGLVVNREVSLQCGAAADAFLLRTDKAVYSGGETMKLVALGGGKEPVFVDLVKDGQVLLTQTIVPSGGRGECAVDLPADLFGTLEVNAYRINSSGFAVRNTRVVYVRTAQGLKLQFTADRPEYRPGERAKLSFTLRDASGRPTPGAISLAAVDEAVFSVLDQAPGMEGTFFTLDRELLKPVLSKYDWSPEALPSVPAQRKAEWEKALFARTAGDGAARFNDARAALQRLVDSGELSPAVLATLDRPDVERLMDHANLEEPIRSMLLSARGNQAAVTTTYDEKVQRIQMQQRVALARMPNVWTTLGIIAFLAVCTWLWQSGSGLWSVVVLIGVTGFMASVMLPSLSRARYEAVTLQQAGNLRQMGQGLQLAQNDGTLPSPKNVVPAATAPRVRQWFPETLLWRPELITDDQGRASLDVDLADSITTWRLSASAIAADGRLGGLQSPVRVFQPFFVDLNLPPALTRGDEVAVPAVVYNYLDRAQTVELSIDTGELSPSPGTPGEGRGGGSLHLGSEISNSKDPHPNPPPEYRERGQAHTNAKWFTLLDEPTKRLELAAGEVRSASFRLRATKIGTQQLTVTARAAGPADAIRREIEVIPDGRRIEQVVNGSLQQPASMTLTSPADAIDGSARLFVKIYPSSFSQVVEGLDGIFQMPYGCFEQTSSTTYPNVLALDYLRRTGKSDPKVEAKARQYIHLGYQRLVGFEVPGGGFDWFGRPPANVTLTAYGLMEFQDMAAVSDVDPALIERTRRWLLSRRDGNGAWAAESRMIHDGLAQSVQRGRDADLSTTAYVAWAVFGGSRASDPAAQVTRTSLLAHAPDDIADPYVLSLVANALLAMDATGRDATPYLRRLESLKQSSQDGKLTWWNQPEGTRTAFYGAGQSGEIETTALAALAMIRGSQNPATARGALAWLVQQKDGAGTWHSTQATLLALKALLAGTGKPLGGDRPRIVKLRLGDFTREISIPADQSDVVQQLDLTGQLRPGENALSLEDTSGGASGFQVAFRYNVAASRQNVAAEPLSIALEYDRATLAVGQTVTATAVVANHSAEEAPMVMVDLPIPAGFAIEAADLDKLVTDGKLARVQLTPRSAVLYLRALRSGAPLTLRYRLTATMPVKIVAPPATVYEYYDPARRGTSAERSLTATPAT